jgi:HAD superfamily hydrolase (TIGR01484 family)
MLPLADWPCEERQQVVGVFTDIDDTLTTAGAISDDAMQALHALKAAGLFVIAITGRPVGWCAALAATWPVDAIVAENGAVALVPRPSNHDKTPPPAGVAPMRLTKLYQQDTATRSANRRAMQVVAEQVLREVPGVQLTRDNGGRETDLAFDCAEYAQLSPSAIQAVLAVLHRAGMHTTVSSIHIHGCFGDFNKWQGACWIARELLGRDLTQELPRWVFVGDSGNDQAMFQHFRHSVGVANIQHCAATLTYLPRYITPSVRGAGFAQVATAIIAAHQQQPHQAAHSEPT